MRHLVSGLVVAAFLVGVIGTSAVYAQGEAPNVTYKKKTVYDFDDDVVEGELMRPDGELIGERKKSKHSSLIKIRLNFIPEMLKSAEDI